MGCAACGNIESPKNRPKFKEFTPIIITELDKYNSRQIGIAQKYFAKGISRSYGTLDYDGFIKVFPNILLLPIVFFVNY